MKSILLTFLLAIGAARSIKDVDLENFTYPSFAGLRSVPLRNGEYCSPPGRDVCVGLGPIAFGDLTGDGDPEVAIVLAAVFRLGNGSHSAGFVYQMRDGQPQLIGRFAGGDRGNGSIGRIQIAHRHLYVTRAHASCAACDDGSEKDAFAWNGRHLELISSEVLPASRVQP
ncbi:MAG TPA: hypothetical protein VGJ81_06525 [Thermoanaerobaculia bacterium]